MVANTEAQLKSPAKRPIHLGVARKKKGGGLKALSSVAALLCEALRGKDDDSATLVRVAHMATATEDAQLKSPAERPIHLGVPRNKKGRLESALFCSGFAVRSVEGKRRRFGDTR